VSLGEQLAKKSRLSGAARSCYDHRWKTPGGLSDHVVQISRDVSHVSIVRYDFRIINTQALRLLPDAEGNLLTENQQWAKLKLVVDIARRVWS